MSAVKPIHQFVAGEFDLKLHGDGAWADLAAQIHLAEPAVNGAVKISVLPGGMESGKPSMGLRFDFPDRIVIAEFSARLFVTAMKAICARYPRLLDADPPATGDGPHSLRALDRPPQ